MPHTDLARATDGLGVVAALNPNDTARWCPTLHVAKYDEDAVLYAARRLAGDGTDKQLRDLVRRGIIKPLGADFDRLKVTPYDTVESVGNLLTTAGLTRLTNLLTAGGGTALTNTTLRLGVGDSTTGAVVGDTDLGAAAGSSHRWFNVMDASNPSVSAAVLTAVSTFASANGNFAWQEWGFDIGTATVTGGTTVNACFFNHKIQSMGTKVSGASWVATATITFS